jgi:hypothetical protein
MTLAESPYSLPEPTYVRELDPVKLADELERRVAAVSLPEYLIFLSCTLVTTATGVIQDSASVLRGPAANVAEAIDDSGVPESELSDDEGAADDIEEVLIIAPPVPIVTSYPPPVIILILQCDVCKTELV